MTREEMARDLMLRWPDWQSASDQASQVEQNADAGDEQMQIFICLWLVENFGE